MSRLGDLVLPPDERTDAPPTRMKGREPVLGLAVAALLVVVSVLNLVITTGAGAPTHPNRWLPLLGLVFAVLLAVTVRYRSRLLSPVTAIGSAFFATVSKAPSSLEVPHLAALAAALAFALILSMRQRREQRLITPARPRGGAAARRGRSEPEVAATKRPPPSKRYTPPKSGTTKR